VFTYKYTYIYIYCCVCRNELSSYENSARTHGNKQDKFGRKETLIITEISRSISLRNFVQKFVLFREALRQTPLPSNCVTLPSDFTPRAGRSYPWNFPVQPIDNIDRPHQLTPIPSVQGRNISPFFKIVVPTIILSFSSYLVLLPQDIGQSSWVILGGQTFAHFHVECSWVLVLGSDPLFRSLHLKSSDKKGEHSWILRSFLKETP